MSPSKKIVLEERIKEKSKVVNHEFCIKISDPFFDIPVKKLIIVGLKVWDCKTDQSF